MKTSGKFTILALLFFFHISCVKEKQPTDNKESHELFSKSAELILSVTSQIEAARDSSSIDSILNAFDKNLTDINFSVPPETDYKLTEEENDSIYYLILKMKESAKLKFENFASRENDSIIENTTSSYLAP